MIDVDEKERALVAARTALENAEHGVNTRALEEAYVAALRDRNITRRLAARERRQALAGSEPMKIVVLEGEDLVRFHDMIRDLDNMINDGSISTLRVAVDAEGVKAKPGRASWSPGYGFLEVN
jgi:hypothetical protein